MQFWISFGCNPDKIIVNNGIVEVIKLNQQFNHDPGGFSLLLHVWSKVSQKIEWVRLLPLIFFIGSVFVLFLTIRNLFNDRLLAFICSLAPFLSDTLLYFSTEIRAYSMECLCSAFSILALCILPKQQAFGKIITLSTILCILMTSRYSAMIEVSLAFFVISLHWFFSQQPRAKTKFACMIAPYAIVVFLTYFFSLSSQNPSVKTPSYIDPTFQIDGYNLFIFLIPLGCLLVFLYLKNQKLLEVTIYVNLLNFAFIVLALLDIHPADLRSKYCIGMLWVNLFFWVLLLAKLINSIKYRSKHVIALVLIILGILMQHRSLSMRKGQNFFDLDELCKLTEKKIYVDRTLSPTIKYLTSYGTAKVWKEDINNQISFQKQIPHILDSNGHMEATRKVENLDLSFFDIAITTDLISVKNPSEWMNYSKYFYQNIK